MTKMDVATFVPGFHDEEAVKKMTYHQFGNTDMKVSRMALGGGPFGGVYGSMAEEDCIATVKKALTSGINYIDTSPWYGNGRSEEMLGKALKGIPRKAYYIGTKVGRYEPDVEKMFDFSAKRVEQSVDHSLKLLGLDYVDVIKVHDLEFAENIDLIINETLPALQKIVEQGKARYIGITGYPLAPLKEVIEKSKVKIDVVLTYARNTLIDDSLKSFLPFFKERGIGVINACAVALGLLCDNPDIRGWHPSYPEMREASKLAAKDCRDAGSDLGRIAVQYSLRTPEVATHLMGNKSQEILMMNLDAVTTPPTPIEVKLADEIKQKFFDPLPKKHWEGDDPARYWKAIKQARGELPKEEGAESFIG